MRACAGSSVCPSSAFDRFTGGSIGGYDAAKVIQERALLVGPIPAPDLRAAQFHEFVGQLLDWGTDGDVAYVLAMRTQTGRAPGNVAEALADLATQGRMPTRARNRYPRDRRSHGWRGSSTWRRLLAGTPRRPAQVEETSDPDDPDRDLFAGDGLLPGPHATLAGPSARRSVAGLSGPGRGCPGRDRGPADPDGHGRLELTKFRHTVVALEPPHGFVA